jgi:hypothetical protein
MKDLKLLSKIVCMSVFAMLLLFSANKCLAYDVIIIFDVTGSTGALLPNWQKNIEAEVIEVFKGINSNTRFALVSHRDFPFSPHDTNSGYAFRLEAALNKDPKNVIAALNALKSSQGGDSKESQYEAVFQSLKGSGRDLNNNGSYRDKGDIRRTSMGINKKTKTQILHFTYPLEFHNDPFEPNYPYSGVVNNPASENDVIAAFEELGEDITYWALIPEAFSVSGSSSYKLLDKQTGEPIKSPSLMAANNPAARLAYATGGDVLSVGDDLGDLEEAIEEVIRTTDPCPAGHTLVELPSNFICVPND